jgi:formate-dependent nitrite reductase membrane component NrfD
MTTLQRQASWGSLVAFAMFFGGAGAGAYASGFILMFISGVKWLGIIGMIWGSILVIVGLVCLGLHSHSPLKAFRIFAGLSESWMSRGGLMEVLFIVLATGYVLPGLWIAGWFSSGFGVLIGGVALILALVVATYHGILLTEAIGVPLWASSVMPLLSLLMALTTGVGLLLTIAPAFANHYNSEEMTKGLEALGIMGMACIIGELIGVWSLMNIRSSEIYEESIKALRTPVTASITCLISALILLLNLCIGVIGSMLWVAAASGVLLLASGFIIRYAILKAGYYRPLQVPLCIY